MAVKVGGTSVISDSRVLENVTGLKTVNNESILGSGNIEGSPLTAGAVGTYMTAILRTNTSWSIGDTFSGSVFRRNTYSPYGSQTLFYDNMVDMSVSGTWRATTAGSGFVSSGNNFGATALLVRIS